MRSEKDRTDGIKQDHPLWPGVTEGESLSVSRLPSPVSAFQLLNPIPIRSRSRRSRPGGSPASTLRNPLVTAFTAQDRIGSGG